MGDTWRNIAVAVLVCVFGMDSPAFADLLEIPSSFHPVGSGARALGMGGAFIAVADDATAASWNPGGLIQLERPEISLVLDATHRIERNEFALHPEADGRETVSLASLNYLSTAYPFTILGRDMVVSLSYQRLFDFTRQWSFSLDQIADDGSIFHDDIDYRQDGALSAVGLAWAVEITPLLSVGVTLNRWDDDLSPNEWEQEIVMTGHHDIAGHAITTYDRRVNRYAFSGTNANIGLLWRIDTDLTLGAVLKTPFEAALHYQRSSSTMVAFGDSAESASEYDIRQSEGKTLVMPLSFGLGLAWQITRTMRVALDVYRTEWDDFVLRDASGNETSPITGTSLDEADIGPTHQVRVGFEYLYITDDLILPITPACFTIPPRPREIRMTFTDSAWVPASAMGGIIWMWRISTDSGGGWESTSCQSWGFRRDWRSIRFMDRW